MVVADLSPYPAGGFGLRQACLYSISEFHIGDELWQHVLSVESRHVFCAPSTSLNSMARAVLFDKQPFERIVR
jgi:hypothetical protein